MQILNQKSWTNTDFKVTHQEICLDMSLYLDTKKYEDEITGLMKPKFDTIIGIDPGDTNIGIASITKIYGQADCFEINFPSERLAVPRVIRIRNAFTTLLNTPFSVKWYFTKMLISVEGSAFSMPYRNTELAEARITEAMWFVDTFNIPPENCVFIPPNTIRKQVFGNGKTKAETTWPELKPDAASALAVAIAGLKMNM